jgi:hypothetical protein
MEFEVKTVVQKIQFIVIFTFLTLHFAFGQCSEAGDKDMAKYKRLTETQDAQGCSQCAVLAMYMCSARHSVEAEDKRKVRSMIEACKTNIRTMGQPYCCPELLNKEPEWGRDAIAQGAGASNASTSNTGASATSDFDNKLNNAIAFGQKLETSFYSMQEVDKNRQELNDLSKLNGKFNSVEEVEMAFQEKFNKIASSVDKTVQSENTAMVDNLNTMNHFLGGDEMIVQGLGLVAGLINNLEAGERKRQYEEQLKRQKEEQISRLKALKASQVVEVRKAFLQTFPDGGLPISSSTVNADVIYIFSYSLNEFSLIREKPDVRVTNVFPISRKKGDLWVFKNTLQKELGNHFKNGETPIILGFFTSEKDAVSLRESFLYLASQCDFNLIKTTFNYPNVNEKKEENDSDFWKN